MFSLLDGLAAAPSRIINRNPTTNTEYSRSNANEGGPQVVPGNSENTTNWTPWGGFVPTPYMVKDISRSLMSVAQATGFYNSAVGVWPGNGQADVPNGQQAGPLMRLTPTGSARPGYMNPTGPNPNMVFFSPPVFGYQTKPIYATGS